MTKDKESALIAEGAVAIMETHHPMNGGDPSQAPSTPLAKQYSKAILPIITAHYEKERAEDNARIAELVGQVSHYKEVPDSLAIRIVELEAG